MNKIYKFNQRNDFLWQSLSIYLIILIIYSLLIASVSNWTFTIVLKNPLIIFFAIIIVTSFIAAIFRTYMDRQLIFDKDFFILKNRVGESKILFSNIKNIIIKKRTVPHKKNEYNLIMIFTESRIRPIKIRPNSYDNSNELFKLLENIKVKVKK